MNGFYSFITKYCCSVLFSRVLYDNWKKKELKTVHITLQNTLVKKRTSSPFQLQILKLPGKQWSAMGFVGIPNQFSNLYANENSQLPVDLKQCPKNWGHPHFQKASFFFFDECRMKIVCSLLLLNQHQTGPWMAELGPIKRG